MKKNLCFVSTTRADFDLQKEVIISLEKKFKCTLICSGTHFEKQFGNSIRYINKFKIKKKIFCKIENLLNVNFDKLHSKYLRSFYKVLKKINPDAICLFGDRSETFIISFVAYSLEIPIIHFSGGEITSGSLDDAYRHSITKMSELHFTTTNQHRKRVIQLGENPKTVFNCGISSLSNFKNFKFLKQEKIEKDLKIKFSKKNFFVTLHPEKSIKDNFKKFSFVFLAIKKFQDISVFISSPNIDKGFKEIQKLIKYKCKNSSRWYYLKNLGHQYFFSTVKLCDVFIGNSSSGISEIPSLHVPTVNIGSRQNGRPRSFSIIDTNFEVKNIQKAIKKSMSKNFQKKIKKSKNLFYRNDSLKIINQNILKFLNSKNKQKLFFNVNF